MAKADGESVDAAGAIRHLMMIGEPMASVKRKLAAMIGLYSREVAMACRG